MGQYEKVSVEVTFKQRRVWERIGGGGRRAGPGRTRRGGWNRPCSKPGLWRVCDSEKRKSRAIEDRLPDLENIMGSRGRWGLFT